MRASEPGILRSPPDRGSPERDGKEPTGRALRACQTHTILTTRVRQNAHPRGFTLIELTIVIVIVGVFLVLSVPRLGQITDRNLKVGSRRLSVTAKYLFNRATVKRTIYRLNYDLRANEYWVTYQNEGLEFVSDDTNLTRRVKLPDGVIFEDVQVPGRGKFVEEEEDVYTHFFPKGWVEETLVHLRDSRGRQTSIHILPLSARVIIYDEYVDPHS
jgi:general secretion pathway protein H